MKRLLAAWGLMAFLTVSVWAENTAGGQTNSSWVGISVAPVSGLGLAFKKIWNEFTLGASLGGWQWRDSSGIGSYVNGGVRAAYRLERWTISPDMRISLNSFAELGGYYDSNFEGQAALIGNGELGLSLEWLAIEHFSFGVDFGQVLSYVNTRDYTGWLSLPLPGFFVGIAF